MKRPPRQFIHILLVGIIVFLAVILFQKILKDGTTGNITSMQKGTDNTPRTYTSHKLFGVNLAGGEFGFEHLPGAMKKEYIYPANRASYAYYSSKGLKLIRLPIRWERIQPEAKGSLSKVDIAAIKMSFEVARSNDQGIILDLHNFGRYFKEPLTLKNNDTFNDLWTRVAGEFKDVPNLYGYELMNEPHDLPGGSKEWAQIAQEAVDAIRTVDTIHTIIIPGYNWQHTEKWESDNPTLMINDPENNILYAGHVYFDQNLSGAYAKTYEKEQASATTGTTRVQPFINWLEKHNLHGIITEYGIPSTDTRWQSTLDNFMSTLANSDRIVGGTYWAGGPWWGKYPLSIEPQNGEDAKQMKILQSYPSQ